MSHVKKKPSSVQSTISETGSKWSKMVKMVKNDHYDPVFLDFLKMALCTELGVFALYSVHQNPSFGLSKSLFQHFLKIFHPKGGPL